ncbi:hypothetical protein GE09DRAFT_1077059 [Coniochaeta sp. 2T2.1]|nr:hypothetical protein GE09DRAFT_1077059 [Coniochaeta sp. 2T2.1]
MAPSRTISPPCSYLASAIIYLLAFSRCSIVRFPIPSFYIGRGHICARHPLHPEVQGRRGSRLRCERLFTPATIVRQPTTT